MLTPATALALALLQATNPNQYDMRCSSTYSDPSAPLLENDSHYSIDLDRQVWCHTREGCRVNPFIEINEAELVFRSDMKLARSTGILSSRRFGYSMQCRKVEFTPMPTNAF